MKEIFLKLIRKKVNLICLIILLILIFIAVFAPVLAPNDPLRQDYTSMLSPPSADYPFGTDTLGRCILSRLIYGSRISLSIGVLSMIISAFFGLLLGLPAGFFGGLIDSIIMRFTDILLSIPGILLALFIVAILGPSMNNVVIAIGISSVPVFIRLVRGTTLSIKEKDYVTAARALGQNNFRIMLFHIAPNIIAPVIVLATLRVAIAIMNAAALGFIGLGAQPPLPEWGLILSEARAYMREAWWFIVFPSVVLSITVLDINVLGDGLRDVLDPRVRGRF